MQGDVHLDVALFFMATRRNTASINKATGQSHWEEEIAVASFVAKIALRSAVVHPVGRRE
jgi:hypothetical protein